MSKYSPLRDYLQLQKPALWRAAFEEIERILGTSLPASAYKYNAWWSNEGEGNHVQKYGWMAAGYRTENVDLPSRRVTFRLLK